MLRDQAVEAVEVAQIFASAVDQPTDSDQRLSPKLLANRPDEEPAPGDASR